MHSLRSLGVATVIAFCGLFSYSQAKTDEDSAKAAETRYASAVMTNDISFISAHLSPGYVGIQPDGTIQDRAAVIAARKRKAIQVKSYRVVSQQVSLAGPTAVVSECLALDYLYDGKEIKGDFQVGRVWQKQGSDWTVLLLQMTPRPKPC